MSNYTTYQPPYMYGSTTTYEPDSSPAHNGSLMPDYNALCLDCHSNADVYSTPLGRYLKMIKWGIDGDMHGGAPRYSGQYVTNATLKPPYDTTAGGTSPNYVLSCLDCHEPHGSILAPDYVPPSSYLLRKAINGERVGGTTSGPAQYINLEWNWSVLKICQRCHNVSQHCGSDIGCLNCHYHNSIQSAGCTQSWGPHRAF
jgi:cytochrome c553